MKSVKIIIISHLKYFIDTHVILISHNKSFNGKKLKSLFLKVNFVNFVFNFQFSLVISQYKGKEWFRYPPPPIHFHGVVCN
jgi:hypothetical protein